MKIAIAVVCLLAAAPATGQTAADYETTCSTLARLTESALKRDERVRVLVYVNAAAAIRAQLSDVTGCESEYFQKVIAANQQTLTTTSAILSTGGARPVKGWTHREVEDLFKATEKLKPGEALEKLTLPIDRLKFDVDRLQKDVDQLKRREFETPQADAGGKSTQSKGGAAASTIR